ncbi:response regulator transcription factor [Haliovirga abyssi]|uniref:DNA-binding response regulator n=1 Tax=Haliovirga abyssi TaxID=2996794 RepID=A0AAU9DFP5_9FUSO|nr:response regulator transcription factor [Haliovirga abyssi]BDU51257.1 DNA-binding response regulator [Haliovirga abyssi]
MSIVIVEDDIVTLELIADKFEKEGFFVEKCDTGKKGLNKIEKNGAELVILDINLPDILGYDVCEKIKNNPAIYGLPKVILLTQKISDNDVIKGFEIGADDYVRKPFNVEELFLRAIRLVGDRTVNSKDIIKYRNIIVYKNKKIVKVNDKEIKLTKKEFELLLYFIINKGIVLSKDKIYFNVWQDYLDSNNKTFDMCLSRLKKKIEPLKDNLENIKGMGYKLK